MNGNTIRDEAQAALDTPEKIEAARAAWSRVNAAICDRADKRRPKPLSYEIYHENEKARQAMLSAIVEGKSMEAAEAAALAKVGL